MISRPSSRLVQAALPVCVLLLLAFGATGCTVFPPLEEPPPERLRLDWATSLYDLESFAYQPEEPAQTLFVETDASPSGGLVVVPTKERAVHGIDAANGKTLWTLPTNGPNVARPTAVEDQLLIGSMDGHVYKVYQRNGKPLWKSDSPGQAILSAPVVAGDLVFVTSIDNRLTALDLATGARRWERRRPHSAEFTITGQAGAAVSGETVYAGFSDGELTAFSTADGATLWSVDLSGGETEFVDVDTTPIVVGDTVIAGSYKRGLFGISTETGDVKWLVKGEAFLTPAEFEGVLYVPQASGRIVAVEVESGTVRWVSRFDSGFATTPALTTKYVVAPIGNALALLDRGTGRTLVRYDDSRGVSGTPDVAFGTAYVLGNGGTVYAVGIY
ncbi:MAG: outer membrane protein assembly factor BamB [Myxococcota bacterium]